MTNRIVFAYFGDEESAATIAQLRASHGGDVIAVALDLGEGIPLNELRDGALAAGALRCHALDVRDEFVRVAMLPALRLSQGADAAPVVSALATSFVTLKLREIATIEQAAMIAPERTDFALSAKVKPVAAADAACLDIRFADGVPFALNHIPMTLTELIESLETITGTPALDVLHLAYRQLDGSDEGQVVLRVENGRCTVTSVVAVL